MEKKNAKFAQYELSVSINAPIDVVWRSFQEKTNDWWLPDFRQVSESSNISFDFVAGGQLVEMDSEGNSVHWYTIHQIELHKLIRLVGHAVPEWGAAAITMIKFEFDDHGDHVDINVTDVLIGEVKDNHVKSLQSGLGKLLSEGLGKYVQRFPQLVK